MCSLVMSATRDVVAGALTRSLSAAVAAPRYGLVGLDLVAMGSMAWVPQVAWAWFPSESSELWRLMAVMPADVTFLLWLSLRFSFPCQGSGANPCLSIQTRRQERFHGSVVMGIGCLRSWHDIVFWSLVPMIGSVVVLFF